MIRNEYYIKYRRTEISFIRLIMQTLKVSAFQDCLSHDAVLNPRSPGIRTLFQNCIGRTILNVRRKGESVFDFEIFIVPANTTHKKAKTKSNITFVIKNVEMFLQPSLPPQSKQKSTFHC